MTFFLKFQQVFFNWSKEPDLGTERLEIFLTTVPKAKFAQEGIFFVLQLFA